MFKNLARFEKIDEIIKSLNCSCTPEFTGVFCEYKKETDHLLFLHGKQTILYNEKGILTSTDNENIEVYGSCSTMLNGQAIIFGGDPLSNQVGKI